MRTSKFDISSIKKKEIARPKAVKILREVLDADMVLVSRYPKKAQPAAAVVAQDFKYTFAFKPVLSFAAVCLIALLGVEAVSLTANLLGSQEKILGMATSAYEELNAASESLKNQDFGAAAQTFTQAIKELTEISQELNRYKGLSLVSSRARSGEALVSAATNLAQAGSKLTGAMEILNQIKVSSSGVETQGFNALLSENRLLMSQALALTIRASDDLQAVKDIPAEFAQNVETAKTQTKNLAAIITQLLKLEDLYLSLFGDASKTYLLIFPNLDEARATGGFIGTYGVLRVDDGRIKKLKIQSVYDFDGSLTLNLAAPGPLQPNIAKWGLRDANWFADFPTSARKMMYMFEKGSQTVDGVISLSPMVFEDILKVTGPIPMPQYGVILTGQNFQDVVQRKTSVEFDRQLNQPKKFLDDFAPVLLNAMLNLDQGQWLEVLGFLQKNLARRQILIYPSGFDGQILRSE